MDMWGTETDDTGSSSGRNQLADEFVRIGTLMAEPGFRGLFIGHSRFGGVFGSIMNKDASRQRYTRAETLHGVLAKLCETTNAGSLFE